MGTTFKPPGLRVTPRFQRYLDEIRAGRSGVELPYAYTPPTPYEPVVGPPPEEEPGALEKALGMAGYAYDLGGAPFRALAQEVYERQMGRQSGITAELEAAGAQPPTLPQLRPGQMLEAAVTEDVTQAPKTHGEAIMRGLAHMGGEMLTDPIAMGLIGGGLGALPAGAARTAAHYGMMGLLGTGVVTGGMETAEQYEEEGGWTPAVTQTAVRPVVDAALLATPYAWRGARRLFRPRPGEPVTPPPEPPEVTRTVDPPTPGEVIPFKPPASKHSYSPPAARRMGRMEILALRERLGRQLEEMGRPMQNEAPEVGRRRGDLQKQIEDVTAWGEQMDAADAWPNPVAELRGREVPPGAEAEAEAAYSTLERAMAMLTAPDANPPDMTTRQLIEVAAVAQKRLIELADRHGSNAVEAARPETPSGRAAQETVKEALDRLWSEIEAAESAGESGRAEALRIRYDALERSFMAGEGDKPATRDYGARPGETVEEASGRLWAQITFAEAAGDYQWAEALRGRYTALEAAMAQGRGGELAESIGAEAPRPAPEAAPEARPAEPPPGEVVPFPEPERPPTAPTEPPAPAPGPVPAPEPAPRPTRPKPTAPPPEPLEPLPGPPKKVLAFPKKAGERFGPESEKAAAGLVDRLRRAWREVKQKGTDQARSTYERLIAEGEAEGFDLYGFGPTEMADLRKAVEAETWEEPPAAAPEPEPERPLPPEQQALLPPEPAPPAALPYTTDAEGRKTLKPEVQEEVDRLTDAVADELGVVDRAWKTEEQRAAHDWLANVDEQLYLGKPLSRAIQEATGGTDRLVQLGGQVTTEYPVTAPGPPVGRVYHGTTGADFEEFDPERADVEALFGPGIYVTDNPRVASTYTARAVSGLAIDLGAPKETPEGAGVRPLKLNLQADRVLDMDAKVPTRLVEAARGNETLVAQMAPMRPNAGMTGEFLFRELKKSQGGAREANEWLRGAGYDALTYLGGTRTQSEQHRAWVVLDPAKVRGAFGAPAPAPELAPEVEPLLPPEGLSLAPNETRVDLGRAKGDKGWVIRATGPERTRQVGPVYPTKAAATEAIKPLRAQAQTNRNRVRAVTLEPWEEKIAAAGPDADVYEGPEGVTFDPDVQMEIVRGGKAGGMVRAVAAAHALGKEVHPGWYEVFPWLENVEKGKRPTLTAKLLAAQPAAPEPEPAVEPEPEAPAMHTWRANLTKADGERITTEVEGSTRDNARMRLGDSYPGHTKLRLTDLGPVVAAPEPTAEQMGMELRVGDHVRVVGENVYGIVEDIRGVAGGGWVARVFMPPQPEVDDDRGVSVTYDLDSLERLGEAMFFVSGQSRTKDFLVAATWEKPFGVDVGELSRDGVFQLGKAIARFKGHAFIDSGAYSLFKKKLKQKDVEALDWDALFLRYDNIIISAGEEAGEYERDWHPMIQMVMPDVVGDQDASLALLKAHAEKIRTYFDHGFVLPVVPIQKGKRRLFEMAANASGILQRDLKEMVLGLPGNAKAVTVEEVAEFAENLAQWYEAAERRDTIAANIPVRIHFLGVGPGPRLEELSAAVRATLPRAVITADANRVRALIRGEGTRPDAVRGALGIPADADVKPEPLDTGFQMPESIAAMEPEQRDGLVEWVQELAEEEVGMRAEDLVQTSEEVGSPVTLAEAEWLLRQLRPPVTAPAPAVKVAPTDPAEVNAVDRWRKLNEFLDADQKKALEAVFNRIEAPRLDEVRRILISLFQQGMGRDRLQSEVDGIGNVPAARRSNKEKKRYTEARRDLKTLETTMGVTFDSLRKALAGQPQVAKILKRIEQVVQKKGLTKTKTKRAAPRLTRPTEEALQAIAAEVGVPVAEALEEVQGWVKEVEANDAEALSHLERLMEQIDPEEAIARFKQLDVAIKRVKEMEPGTRTAGDLREHRRNLREQRKLKKQTKLFLDKEGWGPIRTLEALLKGPSSDAFAHIRVYQRKAWQENKAVRWYIWQHSQWLEKPLALHGLEATAAELNEIADALAEDLASSPEPAGQRPALGGDQEGVFPSPAATEAKSAHLFKTFMWGTKLPGTDQSITTQEAIEAIRAQDGPIWGRIVVAYQEALDNEVEDVPFDVPDIAPDEADDLGIVEASRSNRPFGGRYGPAPRRPTAKQADFIQKPLFADVPPARRPSHARQDADDAVPDRPGLEGREAQHRPGRSGLPGGGRSRDADPAAPGAQPARAKKGVFGVVLARPEETAAQPPDLSLIPKEHLSALGEHQHLAVAKMIAQLQAGKGFLLADGTGVGKTHSIVSAAWHFAQTEKRPVVIVAPPATLNVRIRNGVEIPTGSYADAANQLKVPFTYVPSSQRPFTPDPATIYLTTYWKLQNVRVTPETILVFDEAHKLKNFSEAGSIVAKDGKAIGDKAHAVLFATATPGDTPDQILWSERIGVLEGKTVARQMHDLGMHVRKKTVMGKDGEKIVKYTWAPTLRTRTNRRLRDLFERLTAKGAVLKREIDMSALDVDVREVALPGEAHAMLEKIEAAFPGGGHKKALMLQHQRRQQEPYKLEATKKAIQDELAAGRSVVVFASRVNYSKAVQKVYNEYGDLVREIKIAESEGTVRTLGGWLANQGIPFAEVHGGADESADEAIERFQSGKAHVLIATVQKGGEGINLDDRTGERPRTMVIMTAPFSSVEMFQAVGRIHRYTTVTPSRVIMLKSDAEVDKWNFDINASKMANLGARVSGQVELLRPDLLNEWNDDVDSTSLPPAEFSSRYVDGVLEDLTGGQASRPIVSVSQRNLFRKRLASLHPKWSPDGDVFTVVATDGMVFHGFFQEGALDLEKSDRSTWGRIGYRKLHRAQAESPVRGKKGEAFLPGFLESAQGTPVITEGNLPGRMFTPEEEARRTRNLKGELAVAPPKQKDLFGEPVPDDEEAPPTKVEAWKLTPADHYYPKARPAKDWTSPEMRKKAAVLEKIEASIDQAYEDGRFAEAEKMEADADELRYALEEAVIVDADSSVSEAEIMIADEDMRRGEWSIEDQLVFGYQELTTFRESKGKIGPYAEEKSVFLNVRDGLIEIGWWAGSRFKNDDVSDEQLEEAMRDAYEIRARRIESRKNRRMSATPSGAEVGGHDVSDDALAALFDDIFRLGTTVDRVRPVVAPDLAWQKPQLAGRGTPLKYEGPGGAKRLYSVLAEDLHQFKPIDWITGKYKVETAADVGAVGGIARNVSIEQGSFVFARKGRAVHALQVSSELPVMIGFARSPEEVAQFTAEINRLARINKADAVYFLHNHPSGHSKPSDGDLDWIGWLFSHVLNFKGGVVINHEQFTTVTQSKAGELAQTPFQRAARVVDEDPLLSGVDAHEWYRSGKHKMDIYNRDLVERWVLNMDRVVRPKGGDEKDWPLVLLLDGSNRLREIMAVPPGLWADPDLFQGYLAEWGKTAGATWAAVGLDSPNAADRALAELYLQEEVIFDAVDITAVGPTSTRRRMELEGLAVPDLWEGDIPYDRDGSPSQVRAEREMERKYGRPPGRRPPVAAGGAGGGDGEGPFDWPPNLRPGPGETGWQRTVRFAEARMRARMREAASGIDPRAFWDAFVIGADRFARGLKSMGQWLGSVGEYGGFGGLWRKVWDSLQGIVRPEAMTRTKRPRLRDADAIIGNIEAKPRVVRPVKQPSSDAIANVMKAMFDPRPMAGFDPKTGKPPTLKININQVEDVNHVQDILVRMTRAAEAEFGKARSYRSWEKAKDIAIKQGLTEKEVRQLLQEKGALTDYEIIAARILRQEATIDFSQKFADYKDTLRRAEGETDPIQKAAWETMALEQQRDMNAALSKAMGISYTTVAAGSEAGRALAIHRMLAQELTPQERLLRQIFRDKRLAFEDKRLSEIADALEKNDMGRVGELYREVYKPGMLEKTLEWWLNAILSGPPTHAANVTGNSTMQAISIPERALSTRLEQYGIRPKLEKWLTGEDVLPQREIGEATRALKTLVKMKFGVWDAMKLSWDAIWNPEKYAFGAKGEYRPPAIGGTLGKIVRAPSRAMEGADLGAKAAAAGAERDAITWRMAIKEAREANVAGEKWTKEQTNTRADELAEIINEYNRIEVNRKLDPKQLTKEERVFLVKNKWAGPVVRQMDKAADVATFRDETMDITKYVTLIRSRYPWLTFMIPFIKTPERIFVQAFRRTPMGLLRTVDNVRRGKLSGGEASDRLAQGILGTMMSASVYMLARDGQITGSGPADPRKRRDWLATGKRPYALKAPFTDTWISFARIEPLATTFGFAADLAEAQDDRVAGDVWDKLHYTAIQNVTNKTFLEGMISTAEAVGDPDRYGARLYKRMLGGFVPNLLATAARAIDPTIRETDSIKHTFMSRVPWFSTMVPARLSGTGELITRGEDPLSRFISPFRYAREAGPEKNLERMFLETGYSPSAPPRSITLAGTFGRKVILTQEERELYASFSRRATAFARTLTANHDFSGLDVYFKAELLRRIYRFTHDAARRTVYRSVLARMHSGQFELKER